MLFRCLAPVSLALAACLAALPAAAMEPWSVLAQSRKQTPQPPWPEGDERGMANQIGPATWARCAWHLGQAGAKSYELSFLRSSNEPGAQGTKMDALGHFADAPLTRPGIEKAPPIVTSAVLLDAQALVGGGAATKAGEVVTRKDIEAMLKAQGLGKRGIQPGDVVYVRKAQGLSYDAAQYLGERRVVAVGLDTPFSDPAPAGMLAQMGIHPIENANLDELAKDKVWTSCTVILPLREKGAAGSPVRPVAIGVPGQ